MFETTTAPSRFRNVLLALACLAMGALGGWLVQWAGPGNRAQTEKVVHDYLMAHPEILPKAMQELQRRETAGQLSGIRADVERAWPGQALGNPQGKVTLVEFTDFACTYCRHSVADIEAMIAADPELRVVIRQWPILAPESVDAARMGLAAAEQGKYAAFHKAMFAAGRPDAQTIAAAARAAGVDIARAEQAMRQPKYEQELARNSELARSLGFNGTPSWVVGDQILAGAVGKDKLTEAVAAAKGG